jgi:hypothetical protein
MIGLAADSAPGLYFEFFDASTRGITALPTDFAGFVGIAERGPVDAPTPINSWEQFVAVFGDVIQSAFLAYSVKAFFQNGGRRCHVVRIADPTKLATATAAVQGEDGNPSLLFSAISGGAWGNRLSCIVGPSSPGATVTDGAKTQPADAWSSVARGTTGFTPYSLVRLFQEGSPPLVRYRVVTRVDAPLYRIWWHTPLDPDLVLTQPIYLEVVEFSLAIAEAGRLMELYEGLSLIKEHPRYIGKAVVNGLKLLLDLPSDLEAQLAGAPSWRIRIDDPFVIDMDILGQGVMPFPARLPKPGALLLGGGVDGISGLTVEDFTGSLWSSTKRGLRCLEDVDEVAVVAIPDCMSKPSPVASSLPPAIPAPDPCPVPISPMSLPAPYAAPQPEAPPDLSLDEIFDIQRALVSHCETQRNRIAVLDAPAVRGRNSAADIGEITAWRQRFDSMYAALYFPWLVVDDPLKPGGQLTRAIPPSGHVVGQYAGTDRARGVHWAPANEELIGIQDVTEQIDSDEQAALNPRGINCIRAFPGRGIRIYGARTVSSDPEWRFVNVRRLMMMIEAACLHALQWVTFEPNNVYLRQRVRVSLSNFLTAVWRQGALVGATPDQAFFVKCDDGNNPPNAAENGELIVDVGVAPVRPAEFVIFRVGRVADELEISE